MSGDAAVQVPNPIDRLDYLELPDDFYQVSQPAAFPAASLIELNQGLLAQAGVASDWFESDAGLATLAGNGSYAQPPIAMAYAGHQFGHWVPLLGDGRAHMLGQLSAADGGFLDVQLKGSGRTPYSRGGDGRATLGSVLREYIISEAMQGLGIPTTRSLAVISTGTQVLREQALPGAVLVRTARSHIRVGSFQYAAAVGGEQAVRALADFMIARHFPTLQDREDCYAAFLRAVITRQAEMIAQWMLVGFIHGVMNTDNMSIVGETIDYGPCAFMDEFHPQKVFSSIDQYGRYAWNQQPNVGVWNLTQLAGSLLPLLHVEAEQAQAIARAQLDHFAPAFQAAFNTGMSAKLGLKDSVTEEQAVGFAATTLGVLAESGIDFTLFFDAVTRTAAGESSASLTELFSDPGKASAWIQQWSAMKTNDPQQLSAMRRANPMLIARNHRVEEAIEAATRQADFSLFRRLCAALANPYVIDPADQDLQAAPAAAQRVTQTFCGT